MEILSRHMITKKEMVVTSQKLNPKFDSQDEEMDAITVLICKTNDYYSKIGNHDEEIDYLRFQ